MRVNRDARELHDIAPECVPLVLHSTAICTNAHRRCGETARKVHASYGAFCDRTVPWSRVSIEVVLEAREG
jgi:hypothetical protein